MLNCQGDPARSANMELTQCFLSLLASPKAGNRPRFINDQTRADWKRSLGAKPHVPNLYCQYLLPTPHISGSAQAHSQSLTNCLCPGLPHRPLQSLHSPKPCGSAQDGSPDFGKDQAPPKSLPQQPFSQPTGLTDSALPHLHTSCLGVGKNWPSLSGRPPFPLPPPSPVPVAT